MCVIMPGVQILARKQVTEQIILRLFDSLMHANTHICIFQCFIDATIYTVLSQLDDACTLLLAMWC
jgi:hypothetical protein